MSALIVVAHPDDEVLGCGGTASFLTSRGVPVRACFLSGRVKVRAGRPEDEEFARNIAAAQDVLGMEEPILGDFPNIEFNVVPHLELVRFIERAVEDTGATTVFTHHPSDLNDDHRQTSLACQAAVRLFQRRSGIPPLRSFHYMEVLSSTDWSLSGAATKFVPNSFLRLGDDFLARKLKALECYYGVMRPYPHPRSREVVTALATLRGAQAGMLYAEAFETVFQDLEPLAEWR